MSRRTRGLFVVVVCVSVSQDSGRHTKCPLINNGRPRRRVSVPLCDQLLVPKKYNGSSLLRNTVPAHARCFRATLTNACSSALHFVRLSLKARRHDIPGLI